ncbi:MAG: sigma 54-interacting transcriptional regulator, partial [Duganella sp.]
LMEAEFFGYRKGAFTGAAEERDGFFQAANGGTLMLDEVADLPLAMQVKLLRAIQERRVRKLGATSEEPVDVRLISATHKNLARCVEQGAFRQDLFYRLNVIELAVPPLRDRRGDLPVLVDAILERLGGSGHRATLGPGVLAALAGYRFPGNVRELENILERALAFADDGVIEVADLALKAAPGEGAPAVAPPAAAPSAGLSDHLPANLPANLPDYLIAIERDIIVRALAQTQYNRTQAAQLLGISFRQLRYQMQKLNIQEPEA